jgi:hypothetical protein
MGFAYMGLNNLKVRHLVLISLFVASHANANSPDARPQTAAISIADNAAGARSTRLTAQPLSKPGKTHRKPVEHANLADLGGGVVKEMRATSVFVQERAAKAGTADSWLIALSGFGLVFLQLRRKHKSLPQRRIAPYA